MKKATLIFLFFLTSALSYGQYLDNQFYFRLGYSSPSWQQFGLNEQNWNELGIESKTGANFEMGSIFMIRSILNRNDLSFGINADYLYLVFNQFETKSNLYDENLGIFRAGSKIGPSFSYSPVAKLEFDIYAKADIAWISGAVIYDEDIIDDADDYFMSYVDLGFSTGLNARYGILMLGIEFNTISSELESDEYPGVYLQQIIDGGEEPNLNGDKKSKLPCWNFTIGLSF